MRERALEKVFALLLSSSFLTAWAHKELHSAICHLSASLPLIPLPCISTSATHTTTGSQEITHWRGSRNSWSITWSGYRLHVVSLHSVHFSNCCFSTFIIELERVVHDLFHYWILPLRTPSFCTACSCPSLWFLWASEEFSKLLFTNSYTNMIETGSIREINALKCNTNQTM